MFFAVSISMILTGLVEPEWNDCKEATILLPLFPVNVLLEALPSCPEKTKRIFG